MINIAKKISVALLHLFSAQVSLLDLDCQQRDLIIIVDQNIETIGTQNVVFTNVLLGALKEKCTPIMVSTSLWHTFVERQQEFIVCANTCDSPESALVEYNNYLIEQLNSWTIFFKKHSKNPFEVQEFSINCVEKKIKEQLFGYLDLLKDLEVETLKKLYESFAFYLTSFDRNDWLFYRINDYFFLLIPFDYLAKNGVNKTLWKSLSTQEKEEFLGLKLSSCEHIEDLLDISIALLSKSYRKKDIFLAALQQIFLKKNEAIKPCSWNIVLMGHGNNHLIKSERDTIAAIVVNEFRNFLDFLNTTISTRILYYTSCYAGGEHSVEPYTTNKTFDTFNFPIIMCSLADSITFIRKCTLSMPIDSFSSLQKQYVYNEKNNSWELKIKYPMRLGDFFSCIQQDTILNDIHQLAHKKIITCLVPRCIECLPQIRLPHTEVFIPYISKNIVHVTHDRVAMQSCLQEAWYIPLSIEVLLLATSILNSTMIFEGATMPQVVALHANQFYSKDIKTPSISFFSFLQAFWPLENVMHDTLFLIDRLECLNDNNDCYMDFIDSIAVLNLENVMIRLEQDNLIRVFFKKKSGGYYSSYSRKTENYSVFSCIQELSEKASLEYEWYYQKKRVAILSKQDQTKSLCIQELRDKLHHPL